MDGRDGLRDLLAKVAPGSVLREGLERILHAHMGALIVLGDNREVLEICSGGFHIDAEMSPQRLSELAKMDGAIVVNEEASRIGWSNVHLVPDPSAPTSETGTRHRTAERVARCIVVPVIAVSEEMGTITLYHGAQRRQLRSPDSLIVRTNQLLQALRRFKDHLEDVTSSLDACEVEDMVTLSDVATVLQRAEMVLRIGEEIGEFLSELGDHGRLLQLQLDELTIGVPEERTLVLEDYFATESESRVGLIQAALAELSMNDLLILDRVVAACLVGAQVDGASDSLSPRGLRLLTRVRDVPDMLARRLVERFGDLSRLIRAPLVELADAAGLSEDEARVLKVELGRLVESRILERFD